MNFIFTEEHWKEHEGSLAILLKKEEKGMHLIQVWKNNDDGTYSLVISDVTDAGDMIKITSSKPFNGYVVVR